MLDDSNFGTQDNLSQSAASVCTSTPKMRSGGFVPKYPLFHTVYNRCVGVVLTLSVLPLLLVLLGAALLVQGRPIFYGGSRLGKDRKPFTIYKLRTLDTEKAKLVTANKVLPRDANIETKMGKFLRASRLDELPQLFNIILGDMNIVGPRPVREVIADIEQANNPNYAIRFNVKPGLIGPTQAYMSHGTSKRLRARYNYMLCSGYVNYRSEIALFVQVGIAVLAESARLTWAKLFPVNAKSQAENCAASWDLTLVLDTGEVVPLRSFADLKITLNTSLSTDKCKLHIRTKAGLRKAAVAVRPVPHPTADHNHEIFALNEVAEHLVNRYLMNDPVVVPRPCAKAKLRDGLPQNAGIHMNPGIQGTGPAFRSIEG